MRCTCSPTASRAWDLSVFSDVFGSAPGDDAYSPLRRVVLVTWRDEDQARQIRSAEELFAAAEAGELDLDETDVVVNMPFLTWPDGRR